MLDTIVKAFNRAFHIVTRGALRPPYADEPWFQYTMAGMAALGTLGLVIFVFGLFAPLVSGGATAPSDPPVFIAPQAEPTAPARPAPLPAPGSRADRIVEFIDTAVPPDTGGTFRQGARAAALTQLATGRPAPYGPSLLDLRLGMPFAQAEATVLAYFPEAVPVPTRSQWPLFLDPPGSTEAMTYPLDAMTAFLDRAQGLTIVLAQHPRAPSLAGVWYRLRANEGLSTTRVQVALRRAFDADLRFPPWSDAVSTLLSPGWIVESEASLCINYEWYLPHDAWAHEGTGLEAETIRDATTSMRYRSPDRIVTDPSACAGYLEVSGTTSSQATQIDITLFDAPALLP